MAICYHRKRAWLTEDGLKFKLPPPHVPRRALTIPCGKCLACRTNNAGHWAIRTLHEMEYCNGVACFITLTYDQQHLPPHAELSKRDLQLFMKDLRIELDRKNLGRIRAFFACGEYGSKRGRPHYHLLLLGWSPHDLEFLKMSPYSGLPMYTSKFLAGVWKRGFCPIGIAVNNGAAAYVARYQKKGCSKDSVRVKPFFLSSRGIPLSIMDGDKPAKGALGAQWVIDHHSDLRNGYILGWSHGKRVKMSIPDYYYKLLERWFDDDYRQVINTRYDYTQSNFGDLLIVDDCGSPSLVMPDDVQPSTQIEDVLSGLGLGIDFDDSSLPLIERWDRVMKAARVVLASREEEQKKRLSTLKRGIHRNKTKEKNK